MLELRKSKNWKSLHQWATQETTCTGWYRDWWRLEMVTPSVKAYEWRQISSGWKAVTCPALWGVRKRHQELPPLYPTFPKVSWLSGFLAFPPIILSGLRSLTSCHISSNLRHYPFSKVIIFHYLSLSFTSSNITSNNKASLILSGKIKYCTMLHAISLGSDLNGNPGSTTISSVNVNK